MTDKPQPYATADGRAWPYVPGHTDPAAPEDFERWALDARGRREPLRAGSPHHSSPDRF